ncbi:shikimate dehydrogenase [uncultured Prochlorococcus sp.]|jgi:shikimate dehydrogenase|uniref:shikimate dehydrogenase n=1 Tax=Prochlorococcus sp. TaxID=1220 RepID=UPI000DFD5AEB|nr:shikimate dehydrogenase [uncultured Prochlorococcus sp.]RCL50700.1 MAG: shikimate dehydrogenase [Prochlorococcus sp. MED-G72]
MITSKTSFLALIGNPVSHSLSPIMQNAAIQYLGLDLIYMAIPCKNEDLERVVNSLKKMNCKGLNITIPFKQKVFDMCSEISPVAKKVKAINTLKLNDNKDWIGTNTDIDGFIYPLKKLNLIKKSSLILGSGGAARSVIQGLIELKLSKITIISRKKNSLNELITNFKNDIEIKGLLSTKNEIKNLIQETDLIINTTPVGMSNSTNIDELPFGQGFWDSINSKTIVYDLIYNPSPTPFLKFCDKKGCMTIDGTQMLIAQGAKSLSFWTNGLEVPFEVMHDALKEYL